MTIARATQVDLESTPYYHLISRCVRRAWLCGTDPYTKRDYSHRKRWLVERLRELGDVFAVDVCAYAVMSNHYHVVVRVNAEAARGWDEDEVLDRYSKLFGNARTQLNAMHPDLRGKRVEQWRDRLMSISWLMRMLNELIARKANAEDECTGRFWEGRFKSQALLDEAALLVCMSYVDLNPVRAGAANGLDDSEFTSIYERLAAMGARLDAVEGEGDSAKAPPSSDAATTHPLAPFWDEPRSPSQEPLPMTLVDYVELLDWTGRATRHGRGKIRGRLPALLERRGIDPDAWLKLMESSGLRTLLCIGQGDALRAHATRTDRAWVRGHGAARSLFGSPPS
ncbi:MAG: transposase [Sandaracinaceae bacterium]